MTQTMRERLQALADGPLINASGHGRNSPLAPSGRKTTEPRGYFMPPGSGPAGETCKTCAHIERVRSGSRRTFRKCGLNADRWTHGPGSDIKAGAPACRSWERRA